MVSSKGNEEFSCSEGAAFSDHYAAATTDAQRSQFLAAGQVTLTGLAEGQGTGVYVAFTLNAIAGVIISAVMLRSTIFSKVTASVGLVGNVLELGLPGVSVHFMSDSPSWALVASYWLSGTS